MRIGIVSDSHSNLRNVQKAVDLLGRMEIKTVIHCGDIACAATVSAFEDFETFFVFGNVDYDRELLRASMAKAGATCCETFGQIQRGGRQIAFLHSDDRRRFVSEEESGEHDVLCYGHSHRAEWHRTGKTLVVNPGALHRARPHTLAIYDTDEDRVDIFPI